MKNKRIANFYIAFLIVLICFFSSISVFVALSYFSSKGADSEISDISNFFSESKNNTYRFSQNNPKPIDDNQEITNIVFKIKSKIDIISKLNPIEFSNLDYPQRQILFENIKILLNQNLIYKEEVFDAILPSYQIILSILYTDTFAKSVISNAYGDNLSSDFYKDFIYFRKIYYPIKDHFFELLTYYFNTFKDDRAYNKTNSKIMRQKDFIVPSIKELKYNHQNAIDIFFKKVNKVNGEEIGPQIYSFTSGVVVVAENGWVGGTTFESYKGGGISPKSGNGVIIYDPIGKRFISYFHLYEVNVVKGQIIKAGEPIGLGGNTGLNARKFGHGKHLHFEIFDILKDRFLTCYELRNILFH